MDADRLRLLLIEDDEEDYLLTRDLLEEVGRWEVELTWAPSWEEGRRQLLEGDEPDVCMVDHRLGARTGIELIREVRDVRPGLPMILLTGVGERSVDLEAGTAGADDFLEKRGLEPATLERAIRYAVERSRRRQVEARYRAIIENARDVVTILDEDGGIVYASPSLEDVLGYAPEAWIGSPALDVVHRDDRPRVEKELLRLRDRPAGTGRVLARVRHADGRWLVLDSVAENLLDDPLVEGLVVQSRDVTELMQTHAELGAAHDQAELVRRVATAANEASSLESLLRDLLPDVADTLGFDLGHVYLRRHGFFAPTDIWWPEGPDPFEDFRTRTAGTTFEPGEGMVGSADVGRPVRSEDLEREERFLRRGCEPPVRGGLFLPVLAGPRVVAVVELFQGAPRALGRGTLRTAENVGTLLGRVAEREEAVAALESTNELLEAVVEGVPDALFIKDREGAYRLINRAGAAYLGKEPDEVLGLTDTEVLPGPDAEEARRQDREVLESGEVHTWEREVSFADGTARTLLTTKGPIRNARGEINGTFGISRDVTKLKEVESALRERVKEQRTLAGITRMLARRDRSLDERLQEAVDAIPPGWQHPELVEARIVLDDGTWQTGSFRESAWCLRSTIEYGGRERGWLEVCYTEAPGEGDDPFLPEERTLLDALTTVVGEALARASLEEQFTQAQKMEAVGRLAGGIAHDFNNLLTAIGGYAELLLTETDPEDPRREDVEQIREATERAASLTGRLLTFSRRQMVEPQLIDLADLVREYERMLGRVLGEQYEVVIDAADEQVTTLADRVQLGQVVLNLSLNARDAMSAGDRLALRTRDIRLDRPAVLTTGELPAGRYAVLEVEDTGSGIPPEVAGRVFEPFFTTKETGEGTGLGLSMVYGVVRQAGGQVDVESEVGRGTTVRVFLPWSDGEEASEESREANPRGGRGERVLVVEDEAAVRNLLSRVLTRFGYVVALASHGEEALRLIEEGETPALILTDMVMPRMGGLELLQELRSRGHDLPVVVMTGYTEEDLGIERVGEVVPVLEKPFTPESLLGTLRAALDEEE